MASFDREDTYAKLVDAVAQKLSIDKNSIGRASSFQDLGADSLDMVEIIMRLEELFGIEIDDADAEKLADVEQTVNYIHTKRTK